MVFISTPSDGLSSHYTYTQENPSERNAYNRLHPFNSVFSGWAFTTYPADWDDDGGYTRHIRNAISTWEAAVPQLDFYEEPQGYNYLFFESGMCSGGSPACFTVDALDAENGRRADYLLWGTITLQHNKRGLTNTGKEDMLRHEIGHWIGLDEAYAEGGSNPCSAIYSVMNASRARTG